ncbi:metal ABC transporter solute-binding protein, Zn/Mn family [Flexibacterium corallicola]|uniref:metal ABC transporter solute-binding protein, Zn/Mn family n=1 Tax=Flexibacterium corallicola TaxID=3037259 RepID=UPI00286FA7B5|nr:zinc ABC transporter substrate-binding protein [Pseudovibrio sp. M1P-2-3]
MTGFIQNAQAKERLNLVATVGMIADAVSTIGGDRVAVEALIGTGIDPHSYRQTRTDVVKLGRSDAIFANGLFLEAQMEDLLLQLKARKPVYFLGEEISESRLEGSPLYKDRYDPHVWMSPDLWKGAVSGALNALIELDPEGEDYFRSNAETYLKQIDTLSTYGSKVLASVPKDRKVLVTAHDAFTYLGRDYDLEVIGIQGISTNSEAGLKRIEDLVNMLVERKITAVFVESSVSERNVRALVEGAAAQGHEVFIGGELFSDAMGTPGTYEGSYIGMIDHNMTQITRALGGNAPAQGMQSSLGAGH